jgi:hypothetical protein
MVDVETAAARLAAHLTARRAEPEKFPPQVRGDGGCPGRAEAAGMAALKPGGPANPGETLEPTHTVTAVEFDTEPYESPQPGGQRFTAPHSGRYGTDWQVPYRADPGGIVEIRMTQPAPRLLFDPDALRAAVGERIAIQGPHAISGILRSVDAADEGLSVTLRVEADNAAASVGVQAEAGDG